ncbi:MAG TPA: hypothetical protein VK771_08625 [Acidimicrobiia bacterium]|jgi:hypothetical protein|nr:hypothetical protein [Acidimicrobiia bacterium]
MNDQTPARHEGVADFRAARTPEPFDRVDFGANQRHVPRLRRLMGRASPYPGPIVAITRCWVSRDSGLHVFASRFLDFAVLTPEHLVLCSTGFFTRRPRRRVLREPLNRLMILPRGPRPARSLRVVGDFSHALRFELRDNADSRAFARELCERTRSEPGHRPSLAGETGP